MNEKIEAAKEKFGKMLEKQLERVNRITNEEGFADYSGLERLVIGVVPGDGIGPVITAEAVRIIEFLLKDEIKSGRIELRTIEGLSAEERLKALCPLPGNTLDKLKECHVLLKGPMETPDAGDLGPNLESANVAMRKALDLFANVRPVCVPEKGIDWTFFRENTEGGYGVGGEGFDVGTDLSVDFTVVTTEGCQRVIKAAFDFAKNNGKNRVTAVTKANVIKTTDGKFLRLFYKIAEQYPEIAADDWYIDIMTAKLLDEKRRSEFQVLVLPNLYGDILTDEAAQIQGGVGTAGGANIGKQYAMFEAIHGSAPRMVAEGRAAYADPTSIIKAAAMLLSHIGYAGRGEKLEEALKICMADKKIVITGRPTDASSREYGDYLMETLSGIL